MSDNNEFHEELGKKDPRIMDIVADALKNHPVLGPPTTLDNLEKKDG